MEIGQWLATRGAQAGPLLVGALVSMATIMMWLAFTPARPLREFRQRLDGYLDRSDVIEDTDMRQPIARRLLLPALKRLVRALGRLLPLGSLDATQELLVQAGQPGGLTALDFFGLRLLLILALAGGYFFILARDLPLGIALRNTALAALVGYAIPRLWLRSRALRRQRQVLRALPDALDMLTIGVEAGLAFESAMLKVSEQWDNALTRELRRAVMEMRVGTSRDEALQRMAARTGVADLNTFVAILIQSSQLGVSIAQVLHVQAAEMRTKRRQRAEELARQAGVKMVFPLVFLIFPALMVVILGPALPSFASFFGGGMGIGGLR